MCASQRLVPRWSRNLTTAKTRARWRASRRDGSAGRTLVVVAVAVVLGIREGSPSNKSWFWDAEIFKFFTCVYGLGRITFPRSTILAKGLHRGVGKSPGLLA